MIDSGSTSDDATIFSSMAEGSISRCRLLGKLIIEFTPGPLARCFSLAVLLLLPGRLGPYGDLPKPEPPKIPVEQIVQEAVEAAESLPRLHSLLITWKDERLLERYFHGARASSAANVKSVSKSVISALVGIAIARDLIPGVDASIAPYFPNVLGPGSNPQKRTKWGIHLTQVTTTYCGWPLAAPGKACR